MRTPSIGYLSPYGGHPQADPSLTGCGQVEDLRLVRNDWKCYVQTAIPDARGFRDVAFRRSVQCRLGRRRVALVKDQRPWLSYPRFLAALVDLFFALTPEGPIFPMALRKRPWALRCLLVTLC